MFELFASLFFHFHNINILYLDLLVLQNHYQGDVGPGENSSGLPSALTFLGASGPGSRANYVDLESGYVSTLQGVDSLRPGHPSARSSDLFSWSRSEPSISSLSATGSLSILASASGHISRLCLSESGQQRLLIAPNTVQLLCFVWSFSWWRLIFCRLGLGCHETSSSWMTANM